MGHTMPGNPYEVSADSARNADTVRLASAILALAYEQHTANLIALEVLELQVSNERSWLSPYQGIIRQRMDTRGYAPRKPQV